MSYRELGANYYKAVQNIVDIFKHSIFEKKERSRFVPNDDVILWQGFYVSNVDVIKLWS